MKGGIRLLVWHMVNATHTVVHLCVLMKKAGCFYLNLLIYILHK